MKRVLYSVCIGSLALALTAGAAQDKKSERARPQHRTANVHAARPANTGATTRARHSAAVNRQPTHKASRSNSNAAMNQNRTRTVRERNVARNEALPRKQELRARSSATVNRDRNIAVNRTKNDVNRHRNANESRVRNSVAVNRERNLMINRTQNAEVNRARNANEFRDRNKVAINRNRNFAVNRTGNAAYYRGGNVRVTNNWRGDTFRGQRYAAFRNYHRQWHNRSWWRSHYDRIIFVNNGWYYWNAGYWFPAWGYAPSVTYVYDGPIYAYNGWTPDQVTVNVQEELARAGYYDGPIDGVLGPMTREAIAAFQADNGLAVTSAIDEPTLATLGIA
jgi:Putative peptidoglycan binding domain